MCGRCYRRQSIKAVWFCGTRSALANLPPHFRRPQIWVRNGNAPAAYRCRVVSPCSRVCELDLSDRDAACGLPTNATAATPTETLQHKHTHTHTHGLALHQNATSVGDMPPRTCLRSSSSSQLAVRPSRNCWRLIVCYCAFQALEQTTGRHHNCCITDNTSM